MRHSVLSFLLILVLCLSVGCDRRQGGAQQQGRCGCGATNWFRLSAEPSGFSALMPIQPTTSVVTNETAAGPLVISIFTSEVSPTVAFSLLHNSFPTNIPMTDTE